MLFAVCCDRGAPGSTTVALALAAARGLPSVVVEADPYGGDLALRCRVDGDPLPPTPTVLGLGAGRAARQVDAGLAGARGMWGLDLWLEGAHRLSELVRVVPGFLTAEQGASLSWPSVQAVLESQLVPAFVDLGRIHAGSPSLPIASAADVLIPVCRGETTAVQHLIWRLEQLVPIIAERKAGPPVVVPVVIAARRNGPGAARQVARLLAATGVAPAVGGVGWIAWDRDSVTVLQEGGDPWSKPLRTSALLRSARKVMTLLGEITGLEHADPYRTLRRQRGRAGRPGTDLKASSAAATTPSTTPTVGISHSHSTIGSPTVLSRAPVDPVGEDRASDEGGPSFQSLGHKAHPVRGDR